MLFRSDFYFGRLDLIGKGDNGRMLKHYQNEILCTKERFDSNVSKYVTITYDEYINNLKNTLFNISTIAYKK